MNSEWVGTMPAKKAHFDGSRFTMWTKACKGGECVVLRQGRKLVAFFAFEGGTFTEERLFKDLKSAKQYAEIKTAEQKK